MRTMRIPGPAPIPRVRSAATLPGAPKVGRTTAAARATTTAPDQTPPAWWGGPTTEWACWYDLTVRRGMIPEFDYKTRRFRADWDFAYQAAIPVSQINAQTPFFRGDFWIRPGAKGLAVGFPFSRGLVLDPITGFTHDTPGEDRYRRGRLAQFGYLLVWIEGRDLITRPHAIIGLALQGWDQSSIGTGKR